jgi:Protein of unknown function (DUF2934)
MAREPKSKDSVGDEIAAPKSHRRELTEQHIRERAHAIWIEEGMPEGREFEHWLRARFELEPQVEPEPEAKAKPTPETETKLESKPKSEHKSEAKAKPKSAPKAETKSKAK